MVINSEGSLKSVYLFVTKEADVCRNFFHTTPKRGTKKKKKRFKIVRNQKLQLVLGPVSCLCTFGVNIIYNRLALQTCYILW